MIMLVTKYRYFAEKVKQTLKKTYLFLEMIHRGGSGFYQYLKVKKTNKSKSFDLNGNPFVYVTDLKCNQ